MPYKRKCSIKPQRGAATADAEGLITLSSPLTSISDPKSPTLLFTNLGQ